MSSGASSAAEAASADPRQPLSVRLIGRGSAVGALVVLVIAMAYIVLLPRIAEAIDAPTRTSLVDIGGGATVVVTDDWAVSSDATTLTQGGVTLQISAPHASEVHPAQAIEAVTQAWVDEGTSPTAVLPSPRAFSTDAGDDAVTVALQDALRSGQAWVVSNGEQQVVALLSAPLAGWDTASASAQTVMRSLVFGESP